MDDDLSGTNDGLWIHLRIYLKKYFLTQATENKYSTIILVSRVKILWTREIIIY